MTTYYFPDKISYQIRQENSATHSYICSVGKSPHLKIRVDSNFLGLVSVTILILNSSFELLSLSKVLSMSDMQNLLIHNWVTYIYPSRLFVQAFTDKYIV